MSARPSSSPFGVPVAAATRGPLSRRAMYRSFWSRLVAIAGVVACSSLWSSAAQGASQEPDLDSILEALRESTGAGAWPSFEGEVVLRGNGWATGLENQTEICFDGRGQFQRTMRGRLGGAAGWDGELCWAVDWAGTPSLRSGDEAAIALLGAWLGSHYWLSPEAPVELSLVESTEDRIVLTLQVPNAVGAALVTIDRARLLPTQAEFGDGMNATRWNLSDYRHVHGLLLPHRIEMVTQPSSPSHFQVTQAVVQASSADAYQPQLQLPEDFTCEGDGVPLETQRTASGHTLVRAQLDGEDVGWFVLDSGAGSNCIDPAVADELGLEEFGEVQLVGVGGASAAGFRRPAFLELGSFSWDDPVFVDMDCAFMTQAFGVKIAGIVGFGLFSRAVVQMDLVDGTVQLHHPDRYELPGGDWQPLTILGRSPCVECGFEGGRRGLFRIDTGAGDSLTMHAPAVEEYSLLEGRETAPGEVSGFGGTRPARTGLLDSFELGGQRFESLPVTFALEKDGPFGSAAVSGNIGSVLLRHFVVAFDYPNRRIAFLKRD